MNLASIIAPSGRIDPERVAAVQAEPQTSARAVVTVRRWRPDVERHVQLYHGGYSRERLAGLAIDAYHGNELPPLEPEEVVA